MNRIFAEKVQVTYALVTFNGWDYKVHPNGVVEEWKIGDDGDSGWWGYCDPYKDSHDKIQKAGLEVLK